MPSRQTEIERCESEIHCEHIQAKQVERNYSWRRPRGERISKTDLRRLYGEPGDGQIVVGELRCAREVCLCACVVVCEMRELYVQKMIETERNSYIRSNAIMPHVHVSCVLKRKSKRDDPPHAHYILWTCARARARAVARGGRASESARHSQSRGT